MSIYVQEALLRVKRQRVTWSTGPKITQKNAKKYKALLIKDPENVLIKFNKYTDRIELYNKVTKKTIETISSNDFLEMINKLDYNSGVLVNKSI